MKRSFYVIAFGMILLIAACSKMSVDKPFEGFVQPTGFPAPIYRLANNPVTKEGFELGRKLFYDPVLSATNTISCGSCHIQTAAFTHQGHTVSHGIFDRLGVRNSPPIMNLAWSSSFMWDGGVFDLDLQPIVPITNHLEMDDSVVNVLKKLNASATYPSLFAKAFGTKEISTSNFLKALSQFMVMCISNNAKYDSVQRKQASFTASEETGYTVYKQHCSACHAEPLFTDNSFRSNGLPASSLNDKGRYEITLQNNDAYKFKVPSLRNLGYTMPYMHDGRFFTLDEVLDHYEKGISQSTNPDPTLGSSIKLSVNERTALLSFLQTLNDRYFVTNKLLSQQ